ncbi:hypothetical protein [Streptomyces nogalater]|uniref:Uncharacterized protein n=1 Tax=Streptomyces nogalater TaxID=38314 RepID=A0ABW0WL05_STRNO
MSEIAYVRGDATVPSAKDAKVIAAIDTALARLADDVLRLGASVPMPRIGCGLAGGKWSRTEPLVAGRPAARGIAVTVYDHGEGGA